MSKKLTDKQERFCLEYIIDLNQTQAAIRAGYSEKTAYSIGNENLSKPEIQERLKELKAKTSEKLEISHSDVLKHLKQWYESDITETIGLTASEVKKLPLDIRRLITSYKHTTRKVGEMETESIIELKFVSKEKAIDMINKHIGFYEADNTRKILIGVDKDEFIDD